MKRKTSTIATVATFLVALSFTAAQAGPQTDPMGPGGGDKGGAMQPSSPGGALDQPRNTPGQSDCRAPNKVTPASRARPRDRLR
jgi:hypothetical protein